MLSNDVQEQYEIHKQLRAEIEELRQRVAELEMPAQAAPIEHEPQLYCAQGMQTTSVDDTFTVAYFGCSCGWNSDGKAGETQKWSAHLVGAKGQG